MQNDIASRVSNSLNLENQARQMVEVIKGQANEIQKRGLRIVDLEDKNDMLQKNISLLASANKHLESLIETYKLERQKLLEEIEDLKKTETVVEQKVVSTKKKKTKLVSLEGQ